MSHSSGCLICGSDIQYTDTENLFPCHFCGKSFHSTASCIHGHFICDDCHTSEAFEVIYQTCLKQEGTDPVTLSDRIMQHPSVKMHGPEHHFMVPAVLLSCYYNLTGEPEKKQQTLQSARKRASHVLGGFCGSHGTCGAAMGAGIFMSLILESTPIKTLEWKHSNMTTALALTEIAIHGGPRCCKRDSWLSIREAVKYVALELQISLPLTKPVCGFTIHNKECLVEACMFFPKASTRQPS
ncbi:MAG: SAM-dependent methyltransferase [Bacteroidales bacterium]|nr:SAM-dependent methyltransferase [Bacteroidales bacterium]